MAGETTPTGDSDRYIDSEVCECLTLHMKQQPLKRRSKVKTVKLWVSKMIAAESNQESPVSLNVQPLSDRGTVHLPLNLDRMLASSLFILLISASLLLPGNTYKTFWVLVMWSIYNSSLFWLLWAETNKVQLLECCQRIKLSLCEDSIGGWGFMRWKHASYTPLFLSTLTHKVL